MSANSSDIAETDGFASPEDGRLDSSLERLRALLLEEGGLMGGLLDRPVEQTAQPEHSSQSSPRPGPAQLAASGPRADGHRIEYELLIETIYEGYLLHYGSPRVIHTPERDLGLLAGDRLYALGLVNLVKLGDVESVAELADVITLSALAQGGGNPDLADAVWMAGAHAVGWGTSTQHQRAKALARVASPDALEAMRGLLG